VSSKKDILLTSEYKRFIVFFFSTLLTIILLLITIFIIRKYYDPNVQEIINSSIRLSVRDRIYFSPEPIERIQYISSIFLLPIFSYLSFYIFKKVLNKIKKRISYLYLLSFLLSLVVTLLLIYYDFKEFNDYIKNSYAYKYPLLYFSITLLTAFVFLKIKIIKKIRLSTKITNYLFKGLIFIIFFSIFSQKIFDVEDLIVTGISNYERAHNLETVFYSVSQSYAGKALLTNNFINLYGLYPHFLEPLFKLTGGISVFKFTVIMAFLSGVSITIISLFIKYFIKNRFISFIGISFYFIFYFMAGGYILPGFQNDPYFQFVPIRIFFPSLFIFISYLYFKNKSSLTYYINSIVASASVLWNADTGIIIFITWLASISYYEIFRSGFRSAIKEIFKHFVKIIFIFLALLIIYSLYIFITRGIFPDLNLFLKSQTHYYLMGFNMIKMKLIHPWNIVFITYIIGLIYSIQAFIEKCDNKDRPVIIFLLSILGLGTFSFYQGRSVDSNLWGPMYSFVLLLIIYTDDLFYFYKKYGLKLYHNFIFFIILFLFMLSYLPYWVENFTNFSVGNVNNVKYIFKKLTNDPDNSREIISEINFIKKHTNKKEKIIIISSFPSVYYAESDTVSAFDSPGLMELFLKEDVDRLIKFLRDNKKYKVFVTKIYHVGEYEFLTPEIEKIIEEKYKQINKNSFNTISLYESVK